MTSIDFHASRLRWHGQIARWSDDARAVLRRPGAVDRACVACVTQYRPQERQGSAVNPESRKARISALMPDGINELMPGPDQERDSLIVFNPDDTEQPPYRMVARPGREEPVPGLVLFWTVEVRR